MRRLVLIPLAMAAALAFGMISAAATTFTVSPWAYSCGHAAVFANPATAADTPADNGCSPDDAAGSSTSAYVATTGTLTLSKTCPGEGITAATCTKDDMSAGATIGGLKTLTAASWDLAPESYCGAGAPRLNVLTADGDMHFFGCAANRTGDHVNFDLSAAADGNAANDKNGGGIVGKEVISINIVQDEAGTAALMNLSFTGTPIAAPSPSTSPTTAPTAAPTATPATRHLALTGGGPLPVLPLGAGIALVLLGATALTLRRRPKS